MATGKKALNPQVVCWCFYQKITVSCHFPDFVATGRFWWEREGVFTGAQRRRLHAVSLSRIICDNSRVARVPADPFSRTERAQDMLPCSHPLIPALDLSPWKEPDAGEEEEVAA